jgi:hypothetical protein
MQPLTLLYRLYCKVIDALHVESKLYSMQSELCGLRQCVEKGANVDKSPAYGIANYYSWWTWKKFTLLFHSSQAWTPDKFKEMAMKRYIATAHLYLCTLELYPIQKAKSELSRLTTCQKEMNRGS